MCFCTFENVKNFDFALLKMDLFFGIWNSLRLGVRSFDRTELAGDLDLVFLCWREDEDVVVVASVSGAAGCCSGLFFSSFKGVDGFSAEGSTSGIPGASGGSIVWKVSSPGGGVNSAGCFDFDLRGGLFDDLRGLLDLRRPGLFDLRGLIEDLRPGLGGVRGPLWWGDNGGGALRSILGGGESLYRAGGEYFDLLQIICKISKFIIYSKFSGKLVKLEY